MLSTTYNLIFIVLGIGTPQNFPKPLSAPEEKELFAAMRAGDSLARTRLIEHNLRLVAHIVRKYYVSYPNPDDLVSIGSVGLIKAIDSYNPQNGARFATYAARCIQNEILMFFRAQKKLAHEVSINETIDIDRDGNPLTYTDIICTEDTIADDIDLKVHIEKVQRLLYEILDPRERRILTMRYGLDDSEPLTQREVAKALNISRSYVSRIEKKGIEKLRQYFTEE